LAFAPDRARAAILTSSTVRECAPVRQAASLPGFVAQATAQTTGTRGDAGAAAEVRRARDREVLVRDVVIDVPHGLDLDPACGRLAVARKVDILRPVVG